MQIYLLGQKGLNEEVLIPTGFDLPMATGKEDAKNPKRMKHGADIS